MPNKDSKVKISFTATDAELQAVLSKVESRLNSLEKSAQQSANALNFQAIEQGIQALQRFGQALNDVALQGASFSLLGNEFTKLTNAAGENANVVLEGLEKASKKAISQRDLMLAANRANLLGVADTQKELEQLLEIAVARGDALGVSTTQAFDNIVTGLGRGSALILDNLGILVDIDKINKEYAQSLGKTASALTEAEKKQALINAVIADSQRLLKDGVSVQSENQSKIESLTASWTNFTDVLSGKTIPVLAEVFGLLADGLNFGADLFKGEDLDIARKLREELESVDPNKIFTDNISVLQNFATGSTQIGQVSVFLREMGVEATTAKEVIKLLDQQIAKLDGSLGSGTVIQWGMDALDAADNARSLAQSAEIVQQKNDIMEESLRLSESGLYNLASASGTAVNSLSNLEVKLQSIALANAAFESGLSAATNKIISSAVQAQKTVGTAAAKVLAENSLDALSLKADTLKSDLEAGELSALDLALTFGSVESDLLSPFVAIEEQNKLAQQSLKQTGKVAKDLAKDTEQAFSELQGKVASVLSGALSLDVGVNPEDILPRQDAINEDARRLADIAVKGFDSPWYEYFKNEFPALFAQFFSGASTQDGVKLQAANIIKNFQDGLVPELINKETAKDRVRRALIGEQNMAELAKEIATELSAELGTSLAETQKVANQVLGGSPVIESPTISVDSLSSLPAQFEDSFKSSFSGFSESFASLLTETFSAKVVVEASMSAGKQNGETWGSGFIETVGESIPSALVDILTAKILPNIETAKKQSEQREAAR